MADNHATPGDSKSGEGEPPGGVDKSYFLSDLETHYKKAWEFYHGPLKSAKYVCAPMVTYNDNDESVIGSCSAKE